MDGLLAREEVLAFGSVGSIVLLPFISVILLMVLCVVVVAEGSLESLNSTGPSSFRTNRLLFAERHTEETLKSDNYTGIWMSLCHRDTIR